MSRLDDRLGLPRQYDRPSDDGCADCGRPRMHGSVYCVTCATADPITPAEALALCPPRRGASSGEWHLARIEEGDGLVLEVYEGPTYYPTPEDR